MKKSCVPMLNSLNWLICWQKNGNCESLKTINSIESHTEGEKEKIIGFCARKTLNLLQHTEHKFRLWCVIHNTHTLSLSVGVASKRKKIWKKHQIQKSQFEQYHRQVFDIPIVDASKTYIEWHSSSNDCLCEWQ